MKILTAKKRLLVAGICLLLGIPLFFARTTRDFIDLRPNENSTDSIILKNSETYEQTFIADRPTIAQIGLFLKPVSKQLPESEVKLRLVQNNKDLGESTISTVFIDAEGASHARFNPPIKTTPREKITLEISVPSVLSGNLHLLQRAPDETFDPTTVSFRINNEIQVKPAAYQVHYYYRPPLSVQLAGLLLLAAQQLVAPSLIVYGATTAFLFAVPALLLGQFPLSVITYAFATIVSMTWLLQSTGLRRLPALTGAHVFAFSTWFSLHALGNREYYALVALLPLVILLIQKKTISLQIKLGILAAVAAIGIFTTVTANNSMPPAGVAHPRDVFLDPNQIPSSQKVHLGEWDHYGSYVGIISIVLAVIGIARHGLRFRLITAIGLLGALLALTPPITAVLSNMLPVPPQHFVILTTFALAFFSAWGFETVRLYLGKDKIVTCVMILIMYIALLDLWHVAAATLEYPLL